MMVASNEADMVVDPYVSSSSPSSTTIFELLRSNRVREPLSHLTDCHCYIARATLHEARSFHEAHTDLFSSKQCSKN